MRLLCCLMTAGASALAGADAAPEVAMRAAMEASIAKQMAAVAQQRAAVAKQIASPGGQFFLLPRPAFDDAAAECEPLSKEDLDPLLAEAATREGIKTEVLRSVAAQESGFRPCAVSPKGAMGLMQLMPATVAQFDVPDPFNPRQSIDAGAKYLKQLLDRYGGDLAKALAAYNAGPGRVDSSGGVPPIAETVNYVKEVMGNLRAP